MKIFPTWGIVGAFVVLLARTAASQSTELLVNGGFENGPDPGVSRALYAGSGEVTGWMVTAPVDYIGTFWQASEGRRSIDLDGTPGPGTIAQTFRTTPGQNYRVAFDMAANTDGPPRIKRMSVSVAGVVREFDFDMNGHSKASMGWVRHDLIFTASSVSTTLAFSSLDRRGNWNGAALDNVSVTPSAQGQAPLPPVPVPANTPRPATMSPGTIADFSGVWLGHYPAKTVHVRIDQKGRRVNARFLEGDGFIPAGKLSWYGENTGHTFFVRQVCAQRNYIDPVWKLGTVVVDSPASFSLFLTGCGNAKISFTRR
ncbi:MAG: choice-of-anchor C family protein [Candidatus Baltobacteraceae bacterium]